MSCEDLALQRLISRWSAHIVILHKPPTDISPEAPVLEESQAFCALALPLIQLFAAWALLSIEEIGHIIEEPFNMPFKSTPGYPRTTLSMEACADAAVRDVVAAMPELGAGKDPLESLYAVTGGPTAEVLAMVKDDVAPEPEPPAAAPADDDEY